MLAVDADPQGNLTSGLGRKTRETRPSAVWDKDLYASSVADIKDLECLMTLFQGEVVHRAAGSPLR